MVYRSSNSISLRHPTKGRSCSSCHHTITAAQSISTTPRLASHTVCIYEERAGGEVILRLHLAREPEEGDLGERVGEEDKQDKAQRPQGKQQHAAHNELHPPPQCNQYNTKL